MTTQPARPCRVVVQGSALRMNCELLALALHEAEKLAQRMKVEVRIYKSNQLLQTVKAPEK